MVNLGWHAPCEVSDDRKGIAKMRKLTFQSGSKSHSSRRDPLFERALDNLRTALVGARPVLVPIRTARRLPTRLEARLHALSR